MEAVNEPHPSTKPATARCAAVLIMAVALALVMGIGTLPNVWAQEAGPAAGVKAPSAGGQQTKPAAKPKAAPANNNIKMDIPSVVVRVAWMTLKQDPKGNALLAGLFLKYQLLRMDDAYIASDMKFLADRGVRGVRPDFMALHDQARAFRRKVRGMTGEEIFALRRAQLEAARRTKDSDLRGEYKILASLLLPRAAKKGHVEARFLVALEEMSTVFNEEEQKKQEDWLARKGFNDDIKLSRTMALYRVKESHKRGRKALSVLAREDYGPAQREVAERFAAGNMFPKDAIVAYYWMRRAVGHDAALRKRADALGAPLSISMRAKVRDWISMGQMPEVGQVPEVGLGKGKAAAPSAKPRKMEPEKVPWTEIKIAYLSFRQDKTPQLTKTFYLLKVQVLWMPVGVIDAHRRYMAAERWQARFRALFERGVAWKRAMDKLSPAELYALAKTQMTRSQRVKDKEQRSRLEYVAVSLIDRAAYVGHPPARHDYAVEHLSDKDPFERNTGRENLWGLAKDGYGPAQLDISKRYIGGLVFAKDPAKAYYWLKRAAGAGAATSGEVKALSVRTNSRAITRADGWLKAGIVPFP